MSENSEKIAFYRQQFVEIYHLDNLDWRVALALFPAFGGFFATLSFFLASGNSLDTLLVQGIAGFRSFSGFLTLLAFYGMWTVARNHVWLSIRTKVIQQAEIALKVDN